MNIKFKMMLKMRRRIIDLGMKRVTLNLGDMQVDSKSYVRMRERYT